jgi:YVTN family beta-propeller protein
MARKGIVLLAALLVACSGQPRSPDSPSETRFKRLHIPQEHSQIVIYARTESPITIPLVWEIRKMSLILPDGTQIDIPGSGTSLSLSGIRGGQKLLAVSEVKAGDYNGLTIFTGDVTSEVTGESVPVERTVVTIEHDFSVVAGNSKTLTVLLDWRYAGDLRESLEFRPEFVLEDESLTRTRQLIYVANELSSNISVIDRDLKRVIYNIFVGTKPYALAADQRRKRLYIGDRSDGVLYEMDMVGGQLVRATELEFVDEPVHIEPIPAEDVFMVLNYGSNTVYIMDSFTSQILETIEVPQNPIDAVYSPLYDLAFVLCMKWGTLAVIDVSARPVQVDSLIRMEQEPIGLAIDDSGEWLFISNSGSIDLTVFEIRRMAVERTVTIGSGGGDIAFDPFGRRLYIGMMDTSG